MSATTSRAAFDFAVDWPSISAENGDAICDFWRREGAFADEAQMKTRLPQIVMHATRDGEVAGVCTAMTMTPPQLAQPIYYWRTFVGKAYRATPLVMMLLKKSCVLLEEHARANGYPAIGILLELENDRFRDKGRAAVWFNPRFVYVGRSQRGLDLRVFYFKGAKLKPPK